MASKASRVSDPKTPYPVAYPSTEHHIQVASHSTAYHTFMKLTDGNVQKDNTGVIIPQTIYGRADGESHRKLPSIHFAVDGDKKLGVRLTHLLQSSMVSTAGPLSSLQPVVHSPAMHLAGIIICVSTVNNVPSDSRSLA